MSPTRRVLMVQMKVFFVLMGSPAVWRCAFAILFCVICYLTLKPRPQIAEVAFIPAPAAAFFDLYDNWKNLVGFGTLAFAGLLGWPSGWGSGRWNKGVRRGVQLGCLVGIVFLMEFLQLFIPSRFCDGKDMFWGTAGVLLARGASTFSPKKCRNRLT